MEPNSTKEEVSANEQKLRKLDRRDKLVQGFAVFALLMVVLFNIVTFARLQYSIDQDRRSAIESRNNIITKQEENVAYIKCILLLRYDNPTLTPESPRADVANALDKCALSTGTK